MRDCVPPDEGDSLFLSATSVVHDPAAGRWDVYVDPEDCLVALDGDRRHPSIDSLGPDDVTVAETEGRRRYEGRILLGAGVVPVVGDAVPLIFRDAGAPTNPFCWTAPAGRVDDDPGTTAFREFYEELLVFRDGTPAYVDVDGVEMRDVYRSALAENDVDPDALTTVRGTVPDRFRCAFDTVVTHFGDQRIESELWTEWIPDEPSLEFRTAVEIDADPSRLTFRDGELDRCVELFPTAELASLPAALFVPGLAAFRDDFFATE
ncbi:MAG: hypothetical protein ABEJ68_01630 [Halobacteriaceae archaeon]